MTQDKYKIDIFAGNEVSWGLIADWELFRSANPKLRSPYFGDKFFMSIKDVVPSAYLAVIREQDKIMGYFPFQVRGNVVQSLGTPLTDYQATICAQELDIDMISVLQKHGEARFEFNGWIGKGVGNTNHLVAHAYHADIRDGFDSYFAARKSQNPSFFKSFQRRARALAKDVGEVHCQIGVATSNDVDKVVTLKRTQYKQKGTYDVFDCGWTLQLLYSIAENSNQEFGLQFAYLKIKDQLIACELFLIDGDYAHSWFPAYDADFAKYSPGHILTMKIIEKLAAIGVTTLDFGIGYEKYKESLATQGDLCLEGAYSSHAPMAKAIIELATSISPELAAILSRYRNSIYRRRRIITACEPTGLGRLSATFKMLNRLATRFHANFIIFVNFAIAELSLYSAQFFAIA